LVYDLGGNECFASAIASAKGGIGQVTKFRESRKTGRSPTEAVDLTIFSSGAEWLVHQPDHFLSDDILMRAGLPRPSQDNRSQLYILTAEQQRIIGEAQGERLEKTLRASGGGHDVMRWRTSDEAPICEACGSGQA
jgi:hypothetical protein